jgi:predicted aspartyl protease
MPIKDEPLRSIGPDNIKRPWLFVTFINSHTGNKLDAWALIDTGADDCALPAGFAQLLGHNLQAGKESKCNTGNGPTVCYKHTTKIEIPGFSTADTLIDFMPNLNIPLLGVRSFLSNFILTVDYPKQMFSLSKP